MMICISKDYFNLSPSHMIDYYTSIIWHTKYNDIGDFEVCIPIIDNEMLKDIEVNDLIWLTNDFTDIRIINTIKLQYNIENGYNIVISGYSFSYILNNRIVWEQSNFNNSVSEIVYDLVSENCINSQNTSRNLSNFVVNRDFTKDIQISAQYQGENLSEVIKNLANQYNFGYRIEYTMNKFIFKLYEGNNYTSDQDINIVFSTQLGNLLEYTIDLDNSNYKNSALILGEGQGTSRVSVEVSETNGYNRKEIYVNASELSQNKDSDLQIISLNEYRKMLQQNGESYLENYKTDFKFDCKLYTDMYKFKQDYYVGDKVSVVTDFVYNNSNVINGTITEVVESWSDNGYECLPTIKF